MTGYRKRHGPRRDDQSRATYQWCRADRVELADHSTESNPAGMTWIGFYFCCRCCCCHPGDLKIHFPLIWSMDCHFWTGAALLPDLTFRSRDFVWRLPWPSAPGGMASESKQRDGLWRVYSLEEESGPRSLLFFPCVRGQQTVRQMGQTIALVSLSTSRRPNTPTPRSLPARVLSNLISGPDSLYAFIFGLLFLSSHILSFC